MEIASVVQKSWEIVDLGVLFVVQDWRKLQMGFTGTNAIRVEGFNIEQVGIHGVCLDFLNLERALNIVVMTEIKRSLIFLYDFFASDRIHEWRDIRKTQKFWKKQ